MASTAALDIAVQLTGADKAAGGMDDLASSTGGLGTALGIAGAGVLAFGGFLVGAASAAAEEEQGIIRMDTALKNNIPNWDGNTAAVEAYVSKTEGLAFADDQIRDSLTSLVGRTHDLTQAQNLQAIAMDLARGKNIDLATATEIVGKVSGGNTAILARYGIQIDKGATATEALGKLQQTYAGQAQAYGESTSGSIDRIKTTFGDVLETVGGAVLKIVSGPLKQFADWFSSPAVQAGIQTVADTLGVILTGAIQTLSDIITAATPTLQSIFQFLSDNAVPVGIMIASIIASQVVPAFIAWATTMLTTVLPAFIATMAPIIAAAAPFIALGAVIAGLYVAFQTNFLGIRDLVLEVWGVVQPIMQPFIDAFQSFFDTVGGGGDILGAVGQLFSDLAGAVGAAIPQILPAIGKIAELFWNWIVETAPVVLGKLGELFGSIIQWIGDNGPGILAKLGEWTGAFFNWVFTDALPKLLGWLAEVAGNILKWIGDNGPTILAKLAEWTGAFFTWVFTDVLPKLLGWLGEIIGKVWNWIVENGPTILGKLAEWTGAFFSWIYTDILPKIPGWLGSLINALWTFITTNGPILLQKLGEWTTSFFNWIMTDLVPKIPGWFVSVATAIWTWVSETAKTVLTKAAEIGGGILQGIMDGLGGAAKAIGDFLMSIAKKIWDDIVGFFTGGSNDEKNKQAARPPTEPPPGLPGDIFDPRHPGRAHGGSVSGGASYLVGERGPEMFVPRSSGSIIPNGAMGGVSIGNVIIYAGLGVNGAAVATEFIDEIQEQTGVVLRIRNPQMVGS